MILHFGRGSERHMLCFSDPSLDGFEDTDADLNRRLGIGDLHPKHWFDYEPSRERNPRGRQSQS